MHPPCSPPGPFLLWITSPHPGLFVLRIIPLSGSLYLMPSVLSGSLDLMPSVLSGSLPSPSLFRVISLLGHSSGSLSLLGFSSFPSSTHPGHFFSRSLFPPPLIRVFDFTFRSLYLFPSGSFCLSIRVSLSSPIRITSIWVTYLYPGHLLLISGSLILLSRSSPPFSPLISGSHPPLSPFRRQSQHFFFTKMLLSVGGELL